MTTPPRSTPPTSPAPTPAIQQRIGIGYDIHRLSPGDGIMLGGIKIPCPYRFLAHSDGDVLLHAICDALLGAVAAGDLGEHFPDTDDAHADQASATFVTAVLALPALSGWHIANLDCNIIAQSPRLSDHKAAIRSSVAALLGIDLERVSIKARSNEGLDAIGNKQAIVAQVVLLLTR